MTRPTLLTHEGQTHPVRVWERILGFAQGTIASRLRRGMPIPDALARPGRMPGAPLREHILAAVASNAGPLGASYADILAATGLVKRRLSARLVQLRDEGQLFAQGTQKDIRYFSTAEAVAAASEALTAHFAAIAEGRKAAMKAKRRENKQQRGKGIKAVRKPKPKPLKVAKVVKPKPKPLPIKRAPAPVMMQRGPREKSKQRIDLPVIVPAHVRVQVCPSGKDTRFTVPPSFVGEFVSAWRELRGGR